MGPVTKLLSDPTKWTKVNKSVSVNNHPTLSTGPNAVAWSVEGAIDKCYPPREREDMMTLFMTVAKKHYPTYEYEDLHMVLSHAALMYLLKEAGI